MSMCTNHNLDSTTKAGMHNIANSFWLWNLKKQIVKADCNLRFHTVQIKSTNHAPYKVNELTNRNIAYNFQFN